MDAASGAAVLLQGMTAHFLATSAYELGEGDVCLVHAGAGGVGLLLTQIAKMRGARVIATVSTAEKEELSRAAGADDVIRYTEQDFVAEVKRITGGRGVDVVYDSVGKDTFDGSLDCLRERGLLALFGQSSGRVPPVDPQTLNAKGSLFLTRPTLGSYVRSREELDWRAGDLFAWMAGGKLDVRVGAHVPPRRRRRRPPRPRRPPHDRQGAAPAMITRKRILIAAAVLAVPVLAVAWWLGSPPLPRHYRRRGVSPQRRRRPSPAE